MWVGRASGRLRFGGLSHTTVLPRSARPSGLVFSGLAPVSASAGCPGCARAAAALPLSLSLFFSTGLRDSPLLARQLQS